MEPPSFTSNHQVLGRPNWEVRITASSSLTIDANHLNHRLYRSSSNTCPHRPKVVAQGLFDWVLWPPLAALLPTNPPQCSCRLPPQVARAHTQTSPALLLQLGHDTEPLSQMRHSDQCRGPPCTRPFPPPLAQITPDLRPCVIARCVLPRRHRCASPQLPMVQWKGCLLVETWICSETSLACWIALSPSSNRGRLMRATQNCALPLCAAR